MPVIKVYGLPESAELSRISHFKKRLINAVAKTTELGIKPGQISCIFPAEVFRFPQLVPEIIIFVDGLFENLERTDSVKRNLATKLGEVVKTVFRDAFVEVFIRPFREDDGFWSSAGES